MARKTNSKKTNNEKNGNSNTYSNGKEVGVNISSNKYNTMSYVFLATLLLLALIVIVPMLNILLAASLLAFIFYPLYKIFYKKTHKPRLSSLVTVSLIVIFTIVPTVLLLNSMIGQMNNLNSFLTKLQSTINDKSCLENSTINNTLKNINSTQKLSPNSVGVISNNVAISDSKNGTIWCEWVKEINKYTGGKGLTSNNLNNMSNKIYSYVYQKLIELAVAIPNEIVIYLFVLFITYFLLIDGETIIEWFKVHLPLNPKLKQISFTQLHDVSKSVVFGQLIVSSVQGLTGAIGLYIGGLIFGISNTGFVLWGIAMVFASLIPIVGTALIWLPLGLIQIVAGLALNSYSYLYYGIYVLIYGATLVSNIDSVVRPKVTGNLASVHPLIILIGVIGGLKIMGVLGIFIGPILLALIVKILSQFYFNDNKNKSNNKKSII